MGSPNERTGDARVFLAMDSINVPKYCIETIKGHKCRTQRLVRYLSKSCSDRRTGETGTTGMGTRRLSGHGTLGRSTRGMLHALGTGTDCLECRFFFFLTLYYPVSLLVVTDEWTFFFFFVGK